MTFTFDDSSLSSNQDTSKFLVYFNNHVNSLVLDIEHSLILILQRFIDLSFIILNTFLNTIITHKPLTSTRFTFFFFFLAGSTRLYLYSLLDDIF